MSNGFFGFTWYRPAAKDGFRLETQVPPASGSEVGGGGSGEPVILIRRNPAVRLLPYQPLETEQGLFRTFAETPPTPEGALSFTNRYGALGLITTQHFLGVEDPRGQECPAELLREWLSCLRWMQDMLRLWDLARSGDRK